MPKPSLCLEYRGRVFAAVDTLGPCVNKLIPFCALVFQPKRVFIPKYFQSRYRRFRSSDAPLSRCSNDDQRESITT
jgi:hypothetical protein